MAKPRLIILIRHAQSEGNKNREIHQSIPDHRVKLTQEGWQQARDAGRRLRAMLKPSDTLHFFTSPYRRTRETTEGILSTLTSDGEGGEGGNDGEPSPFKRSNIKVYEEPRLREQDFGNFQPCSAEMERMWQERADYGHFFYRIPNGESAADAYDRVSGFNESLWRQFGEDDFASVCVLVTHGLMSRVFLMKWYHFSVEYFEDLRNVNHCEFLIMRKNYENGKYIMENKLRTWSELRREREQASREKEEKERAERAKENGNGTAATVNGGSTAVTVATAATTSRPAREGVKLERKMSSPIVPRRWGGCPNGCNHTMHYKPRKDLDELMQRDGTNLMNGGGAGGRNGSLTPTAAATVAAASSATSATAASATTLAARRQSAAVARAVRAPVVQTMQAYNSEDDPDDARGMPAANEGGATTTTTTATSKPADAGETATDTDSVEGPRIDVTRAQQECMSSPDGTPSFISAEDRLRSQLKSPALAGLAAGSNGLHHHLHHQHGGAGAGSASSHAHAHAHAAHHLPPQHYLPQQHYRPILLHVGRDGGGTYSGHPSRANSDAEPSSSSSSAEDEDESEDGERLDEADARLKLAAKAHRVKLGRSKLGVLDTTVAAESDDPDDVDPLTALPTTATPATASSGGSDSIPTVPAAAAPSAEAAPTRPSVHRLHTHGDDGDSSDGLDRAAAAAAAERGGDGGGSMDDDAAVPADLVLAIEGGMGRGARANRLGDAPHSSDLGSDSPHSHDEDDDEPESPVEAAMPSRMPLPPPVNGGGGAKTTSASAAAAAARPKVQYAQSDDGGHVADAEDNGRDEAEFSRMDREEKSVRGSVY